MAAAPSAVMARRGMGPSTVGWRDAARLWPLAPAAATPQPVRRPPWPHPPAPTTLRRPVAQPSPRRAELSALVRLAAPLAAAQGGQALMGVVDTAVVGRAGAVSLAGVGLGNALFFSIAILGMGIDDGARSAHRAGVRGRRRRHRLAPGEAGPAPRPPGGRRRWRCRLALLPLLLEPLGVRREMAAEASRFVWWRLPGLPFLLLYVAGRAYLQAAGRTRPLVVATVLANLANLLLDLLLVFGGATLPAWAGPLRALPALGVAGAAISTDLCLALQAGLLAAAGRRQAGGGGPARGGEPRRAELWHAVRLGLPTGLHLAAELGFFSLAGLLAARLGTLPMAAHQLALSLAGLSFTVAVGIGNAGSVRVAPSWAPATGWGRGGPALTALAAATGFMA